MADASDLLSRVRTLIDDVAGDKSIFKENLVRSIYGNQVDGAALSFQLNNKRTVSGSLIVKADGSTATITQSAAQLLRGQFTITSAAPATSLFAWYDFQFFTDTEITTFLTQAGDFVGVSDVTTVPVGLIDSFVKKAASDACYALATRAAPYYNASAGGKAAQKGDISKKYVEKAKLLFEQAVSERQAFYDGQKGKSASPAFGKFATNQNPWTPRR